MSPGGAVLTETVRRYASSWTAEAERSCDPASARAGTPAGQQYELTCLDRSLAGFSTFVSLVGRDGGDWESAFDGVAGLPAPRACRIDADGAVIAPLPDDPNQRFQIEQLRLRLATAHAALLAGALGVAKDDIEQATQQAHAIGYRPLEAEALQLGALEAFQEGDLAVAKNLYLEATNAAIVGHHDSIAVDAQVSLAMIAADTGDLAQTGEYADRADATYESAAEANRVLAAALAGARGRISLTAGDFAAAEQHYARALELGSADHPARSSFFDGLAGALQMQGRAEGSSGVALQNLRYREDSLGPRHPQVAVSTMNLGGVLFSLGRPHEALPYAERALSIASASMPKSAELARIHDLRCRAAELPGCRAAELPRCGQ